MAEARNGEDDRRIFTRVGTDIEVQVRSHGRLLGRHRVHDLGLGGVFIDARSLDLYPNDFVELVFHNGGIFRAVVIRHTDQGVGLMFHDHGEDSLDALREVMIAASLPAPGRSASAEVARLSF
jgi:hypothetical protein